MKTKANYFNLLKESVCNLKIQLFAFKMYKPKKDKILKGILKKILSLKKRGSNIIGHQD